MSSQSTLSQICIKCKRIDGPRYSCSNHKEESGLLNNYCAICLPCRQLMKKIGEMDAYNNFPCTFVYEIPECILCSMYASEKQQFIRDNE